MGDTLNSVRDFARSVVLQTTTIHTITAEASILWKRLDAPLLLDQRILQSRRSLFRLVRLFSLIKRLAQIRRITFSAILQKLTTSSVATISSQRKSNQLSPGIDGCIKHAARPCIDGCHQW